MLVRVKEVVVERVVVRTIVLLVWVSVSDEVVLAVAVSDEVVAVFCLARAKPYRLERNSLSGPFAHSPK